MTRALIAIALTLAPVAAYADVPRPAGGGVIVRPSPPPTGYIRPWLLPA